MGNLVSRKKKRERDHVTDQDRAVLDLKNSRDRLKRYQKKVTEAWSCPHCFNHPSTPRVVVVVVCHPQEARMKKHSEQQAP